MPDEGVNSAGSVSVDVVPNGKQFGSRLKALVVAAGNAASNDLADALTSKLADSIVESVVEGVRDGGRAAVPEAAKAGAEAGSAYGDAFREAAARGTGDLPLPDPAQSARKGAESGGAFADSFKDRVDAALRSLPPIEIGAAATEAEQKIRDIKTDLATLSGQRIGIDISDTEALEKVSLLKADLLELAAHSPSIRVNVDAAAAVAELEAIKSEVNSVSSAGASSAGGLGALATTLVTLGPIAIPSAAAAVGAVAAIGVAALGAAAGVGVEALALSRVIGVVKDMGAAQKESNVATGGGTSSAFAYASALDGLKSAQASYANTVANAADAQRQAAEQVVNAEQSVANAQQGALQAQTALTEARKAAQQQEEDLANSIIDGQIAQQQAVLDQTQAHAKLAQLQANNAAAGSPQLVQAQIDAEAADQRVKELALSQQRLADQQQQATTAGIDGAAGVVSAQQGVLTANQQVQKAEQSLSDARIAQATQARQAAFSIAQAQQGIVSAQRALQQSTQGVGGASAQTSAAAQKLAADMAALTPEGRAFATFIFGLKGGVSDLQGIAEKGVLPGAETFLKDLIGTYGPGAKATVAGISGEIGKLEVTAGRTFTDPFWRSFFAFIEADAVPSLDGLYRVGVNVATGLAGIVRAGEPLGRDFGGGLISFSDKFADATKDLQDNPAFQDFLAYAEKEGPQVAHTIEDVAGALVHISQALAPIGDSEIRLLGEFADVIDDIPVPVLTALAAAFIIVNLGLKTYNGYIAVQKGLNTAATVAQKLFGNSVAALPAQAAAASAATDGLAASELAAGEAAAGAKVGLSAVSDFLLGPWGIAIGIASLALGAFLTKSHDNTQQVDTLVSSLGELANAYKQIDTDGGDAVRQLVAQDQTLQKLIVTAGQAGVSVSDIGSALTGAPGASANVVSDFNTQLAALSAQRSKELGLEAGRGFTAESKAAPAQVASLDTQISDLTAARDAVTKYTASARQATAAQGLLNAAQFGNLGITTESTPAEIALANAITVMGDKSSSSSDQVSALKNASDALYGSTRAAADANEAYFASIDQVNSAIVQNHDALLKTSDATLLHTAAGRADTDAIKAQLDASNQLYFADIAEGKSVADATKDHDARTAALVDETKKGGLNQTAVQNLIDTYAQVPTSVTTEIGLSGASAALTQLENLQIAQQALSSGIPIDEATKEYLNSRKKATELAGGLATGGPVDGLIRGPGTKTSDSVLLWGSAGEWMQPAHAVDYYGTAAMQAIQDHSVPKDLLQGLAHGGMVWPFDVNLHHTKIPTLAQVKAGPPYGFASGGYIPSGVAPSYRSFTVPTASYAPAGGGQPAATGAPLVQIDSFYAGDAGAQEIAEQLDWQLRSTGG